MAQDEPSQDPPKLVSIKGGSRRRGFVTLQIYSTLADLYVVQGVRTMRQLAVRSGISQDTCSKAIATGWPERGWPPLRERAASYDALQQKANPRPIGEQLVIEAQKFKDMRAENITFNRGLRALGQKYFNKLNEALEHATAWRTGVHVRVVDVVVGRRTVQRVVRENVRLPPSLEGLTQALGVLASVVKLAGEGELRFARFEPTDGVEKPGWDSLTDEQLDEIMRSGKMPEGQSLEDLRKKS